MNNQPKIGPTFFDECKAAGVSLEGWSVNMATGAFLFNDAVPQATRDKLAAVLAAHDPTKAAET